MVAPGLEPAGQALEIRILLAQPQRHRALQVRWGGEGQELVRLGHVRRHGAVAGDVAHLPAGQAEGLAGRADAQAAFAHAGQRHQRDVLPAVEGQMLVDLVADRIGVVALHQFRDEGELGGGEDLAGGVHRAVEQDRLGLRPEGGGQLGARQLPFRRGEAHQLRHRAQHPHHRQVGVVERLDQHHLVARVEQRHQAGGDRLGGAGGDDHLRRRVDLQPVEAPVRGRHGLPQLGHAGQRRVLVTVVEQRIGRGPHHIRRPFLVREALAEVDRPVLRRQRRHDGENRGAGGREQGVLGPGDLRSGVLGLAWGLHLWMRFVSDGEARRGAPDSHGTRRGGGPGNGPRRGGLGMRRPESGAAVRPGAMPGLPRGFPGPEG